MLKPEKYPDKTDMGRIDTDARSKEEHRIPLTLTLSRRGRGDYFPPSLDGRGQGAMLLT